MIRIMVTGRQVTIRTNSLLNSQEREYSGKRTTSAKIPNAQHKLTGRSKYNSKIRLRKDKAHKRTVIKIANRKIP